MLFLRHQERNATVPSLESTGQEVNRMEDAGMTDGQYNANLEQIAQLILAAAKNPQEAAQIVRNAKTTSDDTKRK